MEKKEVRELKSGQRVRALICTPDRDNGGLAEELLTGKIFHQGRLSLFLPDEGVRQEMKIYYLVDPDDSKRVFPIEEKPLKNLRGWLKRWWSKLRGRSC